MSAGLAVLISGRGSNLRAILKSPVGRQVRVVISDNPQAAGLATAEEHDVATRVLSPDEFHSPVEWGARLAALFDEIDPAIIALAGFMRIIPPAQAKAYHGRMVNIHPSLLPAFRGLRTHERAIEEGAKEHGCTVHYVAEEVDAGEIIDQRRVPVMPGDDPQTLAARVLREEHDMYPKTLETLLR